MVNHSLKGLDLFSQSERRYHKKNVIPKWGHWAQTTMTSLYPGYTKKLLLNLVWRFNSIVLTAA